MISACGRFWELREACTALQAKREAAGYCSKTICEIVTTGTCSDHIAILFHARFRTCAEHQCQNGAKEEQYQ